MGQSLLTKLSADVPFPDLGKEGKNARRMSGSVGSLISTSESDGTHDKLSFYRDEWAIGHTIVRLLRLAVINEKGGGSTGKVEVGFETFTKARWFTVIWLVTSRPFISSVYKSHALVHAEPVCSIFRHAHVT